MVNYTTNPMNCSTCFIPSQYPRMAISQELFLLVKQTIQPGLMWSGDELDQWCRYTLRNYFYRMVGISTDWEYKMVGISGVGTGWAKTCEDTYGNVGLLRIWCFEVKQFITVVTMEFFYVMSCKSCKLFKDMPRLIAQSWGFTKGQK